MNKNLIKLLGVVTVIMFGIIIYAAYRFMHKY